MSDTPEWADLSDAKKESADWTTLDKQKLQNDKLFLKVYGIIVVVFTVAFAAIFILTISALVWHYIGLTKLQWLSDGQLSKIESILFSGTMAVIGSTAIRSQYAKTHSNPKS